MEHINWFEVIVGIIISIIGVLIIGKNQSIATMCLLFGGYHIGKGLYEKR